MPEGVPIVATSRDGEDIPSIEEDEYADDGMSNSINEIENDVEHINRESEIEESFVTQDTLGLNTEPVNIGDDLGVIEINEYNGNSETQGDIEEETFDNTNLPLG